MEVASVMQVRFTGRPEKWYAETGAQTTACSAPAPTPNTGKADAWTHSLYETRTGKSPPQKIPRPEAIVRRFDEAQKETQIRSCQR